MALIINKLIDTKSTQHRHYYIKNDTYYNIIVMCRIKVKSVSYSIRQRKGGRSHLITNQHKTKIREGL